VNGIAVGLGMGVIVILGVGIKVGSKVSGTVVGELTSLGAQLIRSRNTNRS
jgi:hypothetical protein